MDILIFGCFCYIYGSLMEKKTQHEKNSVVVKENINQKYVLWRSSHTRLCERTCLCAHTDTFYIDSLEVMLTLRLIP